ncbi:MAG: beta-galactosidase [Lachnospiraceae bacterium]|nr:beta-galactosidase [Lachnospiraceae bacterium]
MDFKTRHFIFGGDYNPEQWDDREDILEEDIRLMKKANINEVTLGVFAWAKEEPSEGQYDLSWLRKRVDILYENGIETILSTPSGARPHWLADKYPEVLRVDESRHKDLFGERHNHCYTSPVYREKVWQINHKLAEEFRHHPGIKAWHISNEYGGECHCPLCQQAFRNYLSEKFEGNIEKLNHAWWTAFWSKTYTSFDQIESPSSRGERSIFGLYLEWKRFVTKQTGEFIKNEKAAIRDAGAMQPVTINMMYEFDGLNYAKLTKYIDVASWDSYPEWFGHSDTDAALSHAMYHDFIRALKNKPFLLMESCPTATNWQPVSKLKKPGIVKAAGLSAVAHGADSVQYFQIRQGRGSFEKFHGAVIDHYGKEDTRVFREVSDTGSTLKDISKIAGAKTHAKVALIHDVENRWAMEKSAGPRNCGLGYYDAVMKAYKGIKAAGLDVDVVSMDHELSDYKLIVCPMLYMLRNGVEEKLRAHVKGGGILIMTYWSGIVDENDLCYLGGTPFGLMDVLGLRSEEIDSLTDEEENEMCPVSDNALGITKSYKARKLCDLVVLDTAKTLMEYGKDWYAKRPALCENDFGKGKAYYICADADEDFYLDVIPAITKRHRIKGLVSNLPKELDVCSREKDDTRYVFVSNFTGEEKKISLPKGAKVVLGNNDGVIDPISTLIFEESISSDS